jgi:transcriptional regulator with XRE-family HTH domain
MRGSSRRTLGARLARSVKQLRAARNWTQEQAAEAATVNPRHYQKIEEGSVNATLATLERLSTAFGVDVTELLRG